MKAHILKAACLLSLLVCSACAGLNIPRGYRADDITRETARCTDPRQGVQLDADTVSFLSQKLSRSTDLKKQEFSIQLVRRIPLPESAIFDPRNSFYSDGKTSILTVQVGLPQEDVESFPLMQALSKLTASDAVRALSATGFPHGFGAAVYNFVRSAEQGGHQHVFVIAREALIPVAGDFIDAVFFTVVTQEIDHIYTDEELWAQRLQLTEAIDCLFYR